MAMYHFRIKSDKKLNGSRVSAVKHVEYINREGTFAHEEHCEAREVFFCIQRERKKTVPNRPLTKNGGVEHLKTVSGVIINTFAKCELTSLKFKMKS